MAAIRKPHARTSHSSRHLRRVSEPAPARTAKSERAAVRRIRDATTATLEPSDILALAELARANDAAEAEREAANLYERLGENVRALEGIIDALVARASQLEHARKLAHTDSLTGLANRRTLNEALRRELARAARSGRPLSLLMLDLDGFKAINDTLSHTAGDRALRLFARCAEECTREGDLVARIGGDEFAVMLPETGPRTAREIGERIRTRLASASAAGPLLQTSYGIGVACAPDTSASTLLADADRELLRDKVERKSLRPVVKLLPSTIVPNPTSDRASRRRSPP